MNGFDLSKHNVYPNTFMVELQHWCSDNGHISTFEITLLPYQKTLIYCVTLSVMMQYHKYMEKLVISQSIGIIVIKVRKQGWSPTPVDILVGI